MTRLPVWTVVAQGGMTVAAALALYVATAVAARGPVDVPLGTLHDMPVGAANPAAVALTAAAHGCLTREAWTAGHGTALPARLLMTQGTRVRVVGVPDGWTLAGRGWTAAGWCTR